jgi:DNA-binding CsgD family transcriptional regulator
LTSDDPSRAVWVLAYAGRGNEAVDVARRLGNRVLLSLALSIVALMDLESNEAAEAWWEAAQASHSYLMRNLSAQRLGFLHIQGGAPVDGLLLLREPLTDWMLRGDVRVWDVLHSIALGLARLGDLHAAAQLRGAVGDRHIDRSLRTSDLDAILERELDSRQREQQLGAGRQLDLDALVALGLERIDAAAFAGETRVPSIAPSTLTPRQREVAALIARGMSNKQIAAKLDISRYTAETHVRNILERLDATSRSQVAAWVLAVEHVDHAAPGPG